MELDLAVKSQAVLLDRFMMSAPGHSRRIRDVRRMSGLHPASDVSDAAGTSQLGRLGYRGGGQPLWVLTLAFAARPAPGGRLRLRHRRSDTLRVSLRTAPTAGREDVRRAAVGVVGGIDQELIVGRYDQALGDLQAVVGLEHVLRGVAQPAVADQHAQPAGREYSGLVRREIMFQAPPSPISSFGRPHDVP